MGILLLGGGLGRTVRDGSTVTASDKGKGCNAGLFLVPRKIGTGTCFRVQRSVPTVLSPIFASAQTRVLHSSPLAAQMLPFSPTASGNLLVIWLVSIQLQQAGSSSLASVPELTSFVRGHGGLVQKCFYWSVGAIVGFSIFSYHLGILVGIPITYKECIWYWVHM